MTALVPQPCQEWRLKLAATHPADLEPAERAALEAHLATCAACAAVAAAYARLDAAVQRLPAPAPLEDLPPKLLALWAAEDRQMENEDAPVSLFRKERPMRPHTIDTEPRPIFPERPAPRRPRRLISGMVALAAVLVIALLSAALLESRLHNSATAHPTSPVAATATATATPTPAPTQTGGLGIPVTIFFPKTSDPTLMQVFPVQRLAATKTDLEAFAIQLLIAGPTPSERSQGYFSELNSLFSGPSSAACAAPNPTGGADFVLKLNMKGTTPEQGTATIQFCRPTASPGVGADARVKAQITQTLEQFVGIKKVVILLQNGHCLGAEGPDMCLQ
jgi:Putative zinc-finger